LKRLAVSPALAGEAAAKGITVSKEGFSLPFDSSGELPGLRQVLKGRTAA
jgi:hypothetical protein